MIPLLALSLGAVAIIIERILAFRALARVPRGLLPEIIALSQQNRFDEALALCNKTGGPLGDCLGAVLRHRDRPARVAERHVEAIGSDYFARLERYLPFLDITTTISPLLGLLGTIIGMIGTFNAIGAQTRGGGASDAVLAGVGEALYATAVGITVAVICFIAYGAFTARLRSLTGEIERAATQLIGALSDERAAYFPGEEPSDAIQKTA